MSNIPSFNEFNKMNEEELTTSTDLSIISGFAKSQNYRLDDVEHGGKRINFKFTGGYTKTAVDSERAPMIYSATIYPDGKYKVINRENNKVLYTDKWYTTKYGATFDDKDSGTAAFGLGGLSGTIGSHLGILTNEWHTNPMKTMVINRSGEYVPFVHKEKSKTTRLESLDDVIAGKGLLRVGSRGGAVTEAQVILGIDDDGIFGKGTKQSVIDFQTSKNLDPDGVIGKDTATALKNSKSVDTVEPVETEPIELKTHAATAIEVDEIDRMPVEMITTEIEKTRKELRLEKGFSRKKRRLQRRLERLQRREKIVLQKLGESKIFSFDEYSKVLWDT